MKPNYLIIRIVFLFVFAFFIKGSINAKDELKIHKMELGYPCPAVPFYYLKAEVELPRPSIIEVEVVVNGKVLRYTNLHKETGQEEVMNRPALTHRPPSGAGLSQDNTLYKDLNVIGWVKWQPGQNYEIKINVRMKNNVKASAGDVVISAVRNITAPSNAKVFDPAWKNYKSIVLSETAGIDRKSEPVDVLLAFYPDEAKDLKA